MSGKWYGEATTIAGKGMQQLIERRADGIFTVNFRVTDKPGQWFEQKEFGLWGVSGKIYFTITIGKQGGISSLSPNQATLTLMTRMKSLS